MPQLLVPIDFSPIAQGAFLYALSLAQQTGASLTLLHVYMMDFSLPMPTNAVYELQEARRQAAEQGMKKMLEAAPAHQVKITTVIEQGIAWDVINEHAKEQAFDGIVIGTKGEHNAAEVFFGSVTTHVIYHAPCPVWVVPEGFAFRPVQRIGYATAIWRDNSDTVADIINLAKQFNSSVHCVHVNTDTSNDALEQSNLEELLQVRDNAVKISFSQVQNSEVSEGLAQFVHDEQLDLLAMLRPRRSFFDRLFHRSQTRKIALHTNIPLYIFRD